MKTQAVAIFDIGKTNKKIGIYDTSLKLITSRTIALDALPDPRGTGLEFEQIDAMMQWLGDNLRDLARDFDILNLSITTHGATAALLDRDGNLTSPVLSYTSQPENYSDDAFYAAFGTPQGLQDETFSPRLGFINLAAQFHYFQTQCPDVWERTAQIVPFPQFLGFLLTGRTGWEPTLIGNHSHLWDFRRDQWSRIAVALGVPERCPQPRSAPWEILGTLTPEWTQRTGIRSECTVTVGIHDSNASLLPYLAKGFSNYILNSTGSWCVLMAPERPATLTPEELRTLTFFNMDALCRPVKTALVSGGMEYTAFKPLGPATDTADEHHAAQVCAAAELFILPGVVPVAKIFPDCEPGVWHRGNFFPLAKIQPAQFAGLAQEFFAALNLSLAFQTAEAIRFCGNSPGTTVFIEGGFTKNTLYCKALTQLLPELTIKTSNLEQATLFGTALCAWKAVKGCTLEEIASGFEIETHAVCPSQIPALNTYYQAYLRKVRG